MSTKHTSETLKKCGDSEPIFVLRAQDKTAPYFVAKWLAENFIHLSDEKRQDVLRIIEAMEQWPSRKLPD